MLTAIEIENFKSIGERVRVELRHLTLLYGHNSSGKSTIIQALLYAEAILNRNDCDPRNIQLGHDSFDLGSFQDIIHRNDLSRTLFLKIETDLLDEGDEVLPWVDTVGDWIAKPEDEFADYSDYFESKEYEWWEGGGREEPPEAACGR